MRHAETEEKVSLPAKEGIMHGQCIHEGSIWEYLGVELRLALLLIASLPFYFFIIIFLHPFVLEFQILADWLSELYFLSYKIMQFSSTVTYLLANGKFVKRSILSIICIQESGISELQRTKRNNGGKIQQVFCL